MEKLTVKLSEDVGGYNFNLEAFDFQIKGMSDSTDVEIAVNTYGGSLMEGIALYNRIIGLKNKTTAKVIGYSMSAGTIVMLAADRREMPENSFLLVHRPSSVGGGDFEDTAKASRELEMLTNRMAAIYADRTKLTVNQAKKLMEADTLITAKEAKKMGFVQTLTEGVTYEAKIDVSKYRMDMNIEENKEEVVTSEVEVETTEATNPTEETSEKVEKVCTEGTCTEGCTKEECKKEESEEPCEEEGTCTKDLDDVQAKVMTAFTNVLESIVAKKDEVQKTREFTAVVASMKTMFATTIEAKDNAISKYKAEVETLTSANEKLEAQIEETNKEVVELTEKVTTLDEVNKELSKEENTPVETDNETSEQVIDRSETPEQEFDRLMKEN